MKIRCRHCGEYFCPGDDAVDLISEGYLSHDSVNICVDCWDLIEYIPDDISEMYSDTDMGLLKILYDTTVEFSSTYKKG
jgi:hypothetical protein